MTSDSARDPAISARQEASDPQRTVAYAKVLGGNFGASQLWFSQSVLDRYREQSGSRVMRTSTVGRVRTAAGWSLDFGIADGDQLIHLPAVDLAQRAPASEHQHWLDHLVALPMSRNFLLMRLGGGSCIDDGEVRDWPG